MKAKRDAMSLLKKFTAGASCPIDFDNLEETMFWPRLVAIAEAQGSSKITVEIVKKYMFVDHNRLVEKEYELGCSTNREAAQKCMTSSAMHQGELFCFHGEKSVCPITEEEAGLIRDNTPRGWGSN